MDSADMDQPVSPTPGNDPRHLRAPRGVAALVAAGVASIPIVLLDSLEGMAEAFGIDGGPMAFMFPVGAFLLAWVVASVVLAFAPKPAQEGLVAGCLVALLMGVILANLAFEHGSFLMVLWIGFGGLAIGMGALAGAIAAAGRAKGAVDKRDRNAAAAAIGSGLLMALFWIPMVGIGPQSWDVVVAVALVSGLLVGGGMWALRRAQSSHL